MPGRPAICDVSACVGLALRLAAGADGKVLCQAEGEDGVMSAVVLYARQSETILKFPDQALTDALFAHWTASADAGAPWTAIEIVVDAGRTTATQFDPADYMPPALEDRIPRLVKAHFGGAVWNDRETEAVAPRRRWWRIW